MADSEYEWRLVWEWFDTGASPGADPWMPTWRHFDTVEEAAQRKREETAGSTRVRNFKYYRRQKATPWERMIF
jgi:hypothetical protein